MQSLLLVELLFVTVISFVGISQSLKCYQCRSDVHSGCVEHLNGSFSKECPPKSNTSSSKVYCRKIHQKLKFKDQKSWTTIRECGYSKEGPACYHFKWVELAYQVVCECDKENCNRGNSLVPELIAVVLPAATWIFSYLKARIT